MILTVVANANVRKVQYQTGFNTVFVGPRINCSLFHKLRVTRGFNISRAQTARQNSKVSQEDLRLSLLLLRIEA